MVQFGVGSIGEIGFPTGMVMWVVGGPRSERDRRCDVTVFRAPMAAQFLPKAAVLFLYKLSSGIDTFTSSLRSRDLVSGAVLNICLLVFGAVDDLRILVSGATRELREL